MEPQKFTLTFEMLPRGGFVISDPGGLLEACSSLPEVYQSIGSELKKRFQGHQLFHREHQIIETAPQQVQPRSVPINPQMFTGHVVNAAPPAHSMEPPEVELPNVITNHENFVSETNRHLAEARSELNSLSLKQNGKTIRDRIPNVSAAVFGLLAAYHFLVPAWPFGV
mgnify:CR=1 FL=1